MKGLLQRVSSASVEVAGKRIAAIGPGLLVFLGVERDDDKAQVDTLLNRILCYRLFADESGRMNLSVQDCEGALLVVPQFTLAADTRRGRRPSFSPAADPATSERLFQYFLQSAGQVLPPARLQSGQFGADMQVSLVNNGPVTFLLQS